MNRLFFLLFSCLSLPLMAQEPAKQSPTPAQALKQLVEGNQRYMQGKVLHPDQSKERRERTIEIQKPFATILGCSDSRVSPEILFDQGIGDLFVVRVAGNVVGPVELDSIEYSVLYLGSSLILVMGHENCGAIKAVMAGTTKDIEAVASLITPALEMHSGGSLEDAIRDNALHVTQQLQKSPALAKFIQQGRLAVRGAYYDFVSGKVELLPQQNSKATK